MSHQSDVMIAIKHDASTLLCKSRRFQPMRMIHMGIMMAHKTKGYRRSQQLWFLSPGICSAVR